MKIKLTVLLFFTCLHCPSFCAAQQNEWMHLHLDKDIYLPGENIWFKAYLFSQGKPSDSSSNFYAALYNEEGKLIQQKHYPVFDGTSTGEFTIPDSLLSATLQLRAFTKNMLQQDSQHIYSRLIQVYQKTDSQKQVMLPLLSNIDLKLFPEGGTLVSGVSNYIAFKAENNYGDPVMIKAAVFAGNGDLFDSVYTNALGMGKIQFVPKAGEKYWAQWKDNLGREQKTFFPIAEENSAALHTEINGNSLYYSIFKNSQVARLNRLHLSVLFNGEVFYSESIAIKNNLKFVHSFTTDSLPTGILNLILTDSLENIIQEKLIFIKNKMDLPVIKVIEKSNKPKGKNVLQILMQDSLLTNLSISIADLEFYQDKPVTSINDELLLQSSTTNLYNSFGDEKNTDLVLLTQKPVSTLNTRPIVNDRFLSFSVNYRDNNYALPKNALLTLIMSDKATGKQFLNIHQNSPTSFLASDLIYYDSAKIYFQLTNRKELSEKLTLSVPNIVKHAGQVKSVQGQQVFERVKNKLPFNNSLNQYVNNKAEKFNELQTIKAVVVKSKYVNPVTKRMQELDEKYTSGMFRGLARGYQLNALDDPATERSFDVYSYISFRIPGLKTTGTLGGRMISSAFRGTPILFINETESPPQMLESISTSQLAYVKYVAGIVIGSSFTTESGALYVYTKNGNENSSVPGMRSVYLKGYDLPQEFLYPDYSEKHSRLNPDYRSTLYWNPYIITDKKNTVVRIEYYNNDIAGKQLLTLRGFTATGELIERYKLIE